MKQYYRDLPHIQPVEAIFFVTARLHSSLPMAVLEQLREEQANVNSLSYQQTKAHKVNQRKRDFARFDTFLDSPQNGPYWLATSAVANVLMEAIHNRHNVHFELVAFCIMSNHYHLVIDTRRLGVPTRPLYRILQSLHAYVAKAANTLLQRAGSFWHDESYDHIIRDDSELRRVIEYVLQNPVKAGLVNEWGKWPYSYVNEAYWS